MNRGETDVLELAKEKPPRYQRGGMVAGHCDVRRCTAQVRKNDLMNAANAMIRVAQARNSLNLTE